MTTDQITRTTAAAYAATDARIAIEQANDAYLLSIYGPQWRDRLSFANLNPTSRYPVTRTEGDYSLATLPNGEQWLYLTADLDALAMHPMLLIDPTLDHNTHAVAYVEWMPRTGTLCLHVFTGKHANTIFECSDLTDAAARLSA